MPAITIDDVRFAVIAFLLLGVVEAAWLAVKLLDRCDRHLRALHLRDLQATEGSPQTSEDRAARRDALGLSDGYPGVVRGLVMRRLVGVALFYGVARWWLGR